METKTYIVFSFDIAKALMIQGFELLNTVPNHRTEKPAYVFADSDEFQSAFKVEYDKAKQAYINKDKLSICEIQLIVEQLRLYQLDCGIKGINTDTVDGIIDKLNRFKEKQG